MKVRSWGWWDSLFSAIVFVVVASLGVLSARGAARATAIVGRVLTAENAPAANATVGLVCFEKGDYKEIGSVKTDAEGRFRFLDLPAEKKVPGEIQFFQVYARAPGAGVTAMTFVRGPGEMEIRLARPVDLEVGVTNPAGAPLSGIPVRVKYMTHRRSDQSVDVPPLGMTRMAAQTDAEGRAVIRDLPSGWDVQIQFDDDRFAAPSPEATTRWNSLGDEKRKIVAEPFIAVPAATVSGRVRHEGTGLPAAGVCVGATVPGSGGMGWANTDEEGRFEIKGLPPGSYDLGVTLGEDLRDWTAATLPGKPVAAGARLEGQDILLIKGALITGRLTREDTGAGVPGQSIGVAPQERPSFWVRFSTTDADGRYELRVPAGKQKVYLGFREMPEGFAGSDKKDFKLTVADGETATVNFALRPEAETDFVSGQVVNEAGQPVAKARVLMASTRGDLDSNPETLSGDDGKFRLKIPEMREPADDVLLLASHRTTGATAAPVTVARGARTTLKLDAAGPAAIEGKILDPEGRPIAGAEVMGSSDLSELGGVNLSAETDAEGRYRFAELWPGARYEVWVKAKGFGSESMDEVMLGRGEVKRVPDLRLERAEMTLRGKVVDDRAQPVAGVLVRASADKSEAEATTNERGEFRLENLTAGWLTLSLAHHGQNYLEVLRTKAGNTDVVVEKPQRPSSASDYSAPRAKLATHLIGKSAPVPSVEPGSWIGSPLPDDPAPALRGKVVVLDFWAVLCGGCVAELPNIEAFWEENKERGLLVLGIGSRRHPVAEVKEFLETHRPAITYPLARDGKGSKTAQDYGVSVLPCYAVIDREGRLAYVGREWNEAKTKAGELLGR